MLCLEGSYPRDSIKSFFMTALHNFLHLCFPLLLVLHCFNEAINVSNNFANVGIKMIFQAVVIYFVLKLMN